jgi:hypothetical protein
VTSQRWNCLCQAFPDLSAFTTGLVFRPRIVDIALIPEVRAIIDADLKVKLTKEGLKAALTPQLPALLIRWSNALEEQVREHTRTTLKLPLGGNDPLSHPLAYFSCKNACCQGHFTGQWKPCSAYSYRSSSEAETYESRAALAFHCEPYTISGMFNLERACAVLPDVIKLYGKDPQTTTCEELDAAPMKLWCMRCKMENQPTSWRDAVRSVYLLARNYH